MAKYTVYIKGRGRGLRSNTINASSYEALRKQANNWLEHGTDVTVKTAGGKVTQFTVR